MARVFLSYDREDDAKARAIAAALEKAGHSVWWDRHIRSGAQYSKEIEHAIKAADAVVVLWSDGSIESPWVRDEAAAGRDGGRLVPVLISKVQPPLGFRQYQSSDLSNWRGRTDTRQFHQLLQAIENLAGDPRAKAPPEPDRKSMTRPSRVLWLWLGAFGILAVVAALFAWGPWRDRSAAPVVAVTASSQSEAAQQLARDLFVRLGTAQAGRSAGIELVRGAGQSNVDLILEVSGGTSSANLMLLRGEDRQLLLSHDFAASAGREAALRTTLDVAADAALGCATAALAARPAPELELLKAYLSACTRFNSLYGSEEAYIPISRLEQIVKREPRFTPALKQLLLAGAFMRSIPTENAKPSEQWLKTLIETSKSIDAGMPELGLAELEILPATDFGGRFRRMDALAAAHPEDLFVLGAQAELLMRVGRNTDAVETAERAVRLYPLSPYARSEYVRTLAFSGRSDRASEELKAMDVLDEVAMNLTESKFRFNLAYGDPRSALSLFRKYGTNTRNEAILLARIEPTQANQRQAIELARSDAVSRGFYAPFSEILVMFGREDEGYDTLMRVPSEHADQYLLQTLFRPTLKTLRQSPRFLRIAQRFGLLDYWRRSGHWPDFCSEPGLPYDCKAEAAKLS